MWIFGKMNKNKDCWEDFSLSELITAIASILNFDRKGNSTKGIFNVQGTWHSLSRLPTMVYSQPDNPPPLRGHPYLSSGDEGFAFQKNCQNFHEGGHAPKPP
jgi:hypothetical protein